ncbi:hypothetical protein DFP72DRAFT_1068290 [Ephemerocybe angulata]|uniref:DUF6533 domain-containing protein n=1 Tax=Ephemerocybe angulata TaxID=980116 RepID=A0A8H6HRP3_9AGAR|nr:hypothetical protein DFP72DRAFT_1172024 [Tulosesus angulatus]KAF6754721.1 hypothetical protein DFP72DRAFT_1068290 [Tulosesus angulatus]
MSNPLQLLVTGLTVFRDTRYSRAAALTFLTCDILSNFSDEVKHIWKARWTLSKAMYIFARYYVLFYLSFTLAVENHQNVLQTDHTPIVGYYYYLTLGNLAHTAVVDTIFVLRIHALWAQNRKILIFFSLLCIAEIGLEFFGTFWSGREASTHAMPAFLPGLQGCWTNFADPKSLGLIAWIPCSIVPFLFFVGTMIKFRESITFPGSRQSFFQAIRDTRQISPLLLVFVRDGAFFFFLTTLITIICTFLSEYQKSIYFGPSFPWFASVYSVAGSHMVLNLRREGAGSGRPTQVYNVGASGTGNTIKLDPMSFKKGPTHSSYDSTVIMVSQSHERTLV